jgi:hypothetical protein
MRSLCILVLLVWIADVRSGDPMLCAGRKATSQPVIDFCNALDNATLVLRCCFSADQKKILAVDMVNLGLTHVPDFTQDANLDARVIDLRGNPQMEPMNASDFLTLTALNDLYLPNQYDCPGGARVWQSINKTTIHWAIIASSRKISVTIPRTRAPIRDRTAVSMDRIISFVYVNRVITDINVFAREHSRPQPF